ncbi:MAG: hypothetical protein IKG46_14250 [Solobacterium sp.]|nr:hypothetical protein [Solobacterium sp.]
MFVLPAYSAPDFMQECFVNAPEIRTAVCEEDGLAPEYFHSTSMFPEYFHHDGTWVLAEESRMDCCVIFNGNSFAVTEPRRLKKGDIVVLGREEDGSEGIYVHAGGFPEKERSGDVFAFRQRRSRETAFSRDYDRFVELLRYEKDHGNIVWVMGPACSFDYDSRRSFAWLIENGYVNGLLAGNALATHDLEAAHLHTALGQDIYTGISAPLGHYNHLDVINRVRASGSVRDFVIDHDLHDGIMASCVRHEVPFVLAGSIRDDGPLPDVITDTRKAQDAMRDIIRRATTVVCLATQLHTIASGNMTPSFRVVNGIVRPLYIYCVDISEFVTNKLHDRGTLSAVSITANVQDFAVITARNLGMQ